MSADRPGSDYFPKHGGCRDYFESLPHRGGEALQARQGHDRDTFVEAVLMGTGVDYPKVLQLKIVHGNDHGAAPVGRIGIFELETVPLAAGHNQQIQFRSGMGGPEVNMTGPKNGKNLLHGKTFP